MEVEKLGNLRPDEKFQSGEVVGTNGLAPTICTGTHGYCNANIAEVKRLGNIYGHEGASFAGQVYDSDGIAPTLNTMMGGNREPMIVEQTIVAMRGRNPEDPTDRTPGIPTEQRLEPNTQGICNTITSVQKDNLVLEKRKIKIRQATKDGFIECELPGIADLEYPSSQTRRGRVIEGGADMSYSDNGEYP